jgi:Bacterial PH domain/Protein of unknown function (DUF2510)/Short C-terminal domain
MGASRQGTPGPGWYPDPRGVGELHWWDGEQWTTHVQGAPREASDGEKHAGAASDVGAKHPKRGVNEQPSKGNLRPDIASAKRRMRVTFGGGREIKRLEAHLWEGKTVDQMTTGVYGKGNGLVVLTDRRLLFLHEGLVSQTSEDFPLDKVSSVQWSSGLAIRTIVISASGNKSEIKNVQKNYGKEIVDKIRHRLTAPTDISRPTEATEARATPDPIDQLRKLGELRDAGVLTAQEFENEKTELLDRL